MSNIIEFISKLHPFQDIGKAKLEQVAACLNSKILQPNEYLFHSGEAYHKTVYIVQQGKMERQHSSGQILT